MKLEDIGYVSDVVGPYVAALGLCLTAHEVRLVLADWPWLTDAAEQAATLTDADWKFVLRHRRNEKPDVAMRVCDVAGKILLPAALMKVAEIAHDYKVPDGTAVRRLVDVGALP